MSSQQGVLLPAVFYSLNQAIYLCEFYQVEL